MTPHRYYLDLRLQRARALLQYSDLAVVEISVASGFASPAHFSRAYRSWAGKAPTEERRRTQGGIMPTLR
jgi:AraC family carnitine catabolism transcriptional activator